jgi:hypothetical protein
MAKLVPETVAQILQSIPETENARVHSDFVEAILAMPAKLAATFVPNVVRSSGSDLCWRLPWCRGDLWSYQLKK